MPDNPKRTILSKYIKNNEPEVESQIPFTYGNDMITFFDSWLASPEYTKRLEKNGYVNPFQTIYNRRKSLSNLELTYDKNNRSMANAAPNPKSKSFVNINENELNDLNIPINTGKAHEISHIIGAKQHFQNPNVGFNDYEHNLIKDSIIRKRPDITGVQGSIENKQSHKDFDNWKYMLKSEEIKADLDASRWNLFNKGIYDIRQGEQFNIDHLNKAKEIFKNDASFDRLLKQVGDDNYINLMNTIANNDDDNNMNQYQAKYGGYFNPMKHSYSLGGFFGQGMEAGSGANMTGMVGNALSGLIPTQNSRGFTSIGGSTAKGALQGAASGAALGPIGMAVGAGIGGLTSFIGSKKARSEEETAYRDNAELQLNQQLASMNYGMQNSSNLPMANGGSYNPMDASMNPVGTFSEFEGGGTHEQNPYGGIPQGMTAQGQLRTVEANESSFKFKEDKYIFSNRLKF